jgi:Xaa-Pro aminopeptidase
MMLLDKIQQALQRESFDGWLFFDHHRRDPLAYHILGLPESAKPSRRWYYFIPASGEPRKLVHQIESGNLDSLPGKKACYSSWVEQQRELKSLLSNAKHIAMQYSPQCSIPYISLVDAGTYELVTGCDVQVSSSANLVQEFEARWSEKQLEMHLAAGQKVDRARRDAFVFIGDRLRSGDPVNEYQIQQFVRERFSEAGLVTDHGPIVGANANASDPHYEPSVERHAFIQNGDVVLIDMWAKLPDEDAVYYDITWTGYCGQSIPDQVANVFDVVMQARVRACDFIKGRVRDKARLCGYEVDDVCRGAIAERGFGQYFFHRTGHNIGTEVHGTGANMDNLESHDDRLVIASTCFSVEPGVYLPAFGIRSEVNVFVGESEARVTGEEQRELIRI